MKPRVALLFEFPSVSGGENSMLALIDELQREFDLCAIAPESGQLADALLERGIEHFAFDVRVHNQRREYGELLASLRWTVRESGCDLLHANSLTMGRLTGALARNEAAAFVPVAHLRDIMRISARAAEELNANQCLIAVSEATRAWHLQQGLDAGRLTVIHNGISASQFRATRSRDEMRRELGIASQEPAVLTIGQIGMRKGQDVLAAAAGLLSTSLPLHFLIAGTRTSGKQENVDFEAKLRTDFARAGVSGRVHWLGYRTDPADLMAAADLLVHPARQEPFGRVLLEAAISELPIVTTSVGGTSEMLPPDCARLVPPDNAQLLAQAIEQLLSSPEQRRRQAAQALEHVQTEFTLIQAARKTIECWQRALEG